MPNTTRILVTALIVTSLGSNLVAQAAPAASAAPAKPTIVLVHGAFADGSSWSKVIPILQRDGYTVIAVQNPLTSLAADVETTKRVIDAQTGPVVLVGHSYGGAVITQAAAGSANVKALVYVAAFAPEVGEPIGAFGERYPTQLGTGFRPDKAGFLYIDPARFHELFAADVRWPRPAWRRPRRSRSSAAYLARPWTRRRGRRFRHGTSCPRTTKPSIPTSSGSMPIA